MLDILVKSKDFTFSTMSGPPLGPTQSPVQWIWWFFSQGWSNYSMTQFIPLHLLKTKKTRRPGFILGCSAYYLTFTRIFHVLGTSLPSMVRTFSYDFVNFLWDLFKCFRFLLCVCFYLVDVCTVFLFYVLFVKFCDQFVIFWYAVDFQEWNPSL